MYSKQLSRTSISALQPILAMHFVFTVTAKVDITHEANTQERRNNRDRTRNSRGDYRPRIETRVAPAAL